MICRIVRYFLAIAVTLSLSPLVLVLVGSAAAEFATPWGIRSAPPAGVAAPQWPERLLYAGGSLGSAAVLTLAIIAIWIFAVGCESCKTAREADRHVAQGTQRT